MYYGQNSNNVFLKKSIKEKKSCSYFETYSTTQRTSRIDTFLFFVRLFVVAAVSDSSQQYFQKKLGGVCP
jgi:hypothetical protein